MKITINIWNWFNKSLF